METAAYLTAKALQFRRLAQTYLVPASVEGLNSLAADLEAQAVKARAAESIERRQGRPSRSDDGTGKS